MLSKEEQEWIDDLRVEVAAAKVDGGWRMGSLPGHTVIAALFRERDELKAENVKLRYGIALALKEIGIPQPGYPAPIANAFSFLTAALSTTPTDRPTGTEGK